MSAIPVVDSATELTCAPLQEMLSVEVVESPPLATSTFAHRSPPSVEGLIQRPTEPAHNDSRYLKSSDSAEENDATLPRTSHRYMSCPNRPTSTGPSPGARGGTPDTGVVPDPQAVPCIGAVPNRGAQASAFRCLLLKRPSGMIASKDPRNR
ncbi:hypothetical protein HPB51_008942 [Rhipicephalus microplus]|uniref:Uncharacterized protein n=1 Tax=Rhipicephalus microplus TaxID=6941 RepID=A0A9J6D4K2_RHIMP|nr:hypothetical protein HPB51_008942 [Rhipicephalus microplus]